MTGLEVDWTIKTSLPRTDSSISTKISPSANDALTFPLCSNFSAISLANSPLADNAKTVIYFHFLLLFPFDFFFF